jgi:hypothetical protein
VFPKCRLVELQLGAGPHLRQLLHRGIVDRLAEQPEGPFDGRQAEGDVPPHLVRRHAAGEQGEQMGHEIQGHAELTQVGPGELAELVPTVVTAESLTAELVQFLVLAARAAPVPVPANLPKTCLTFCQAGS